jgi:hypothetical protein
MCGYIGAPINAEVVFWRLNMQADVQTPFSAPFFADRYLGAQPPCLETRIVLFEQLRAVVTRAAEIPSEIVAIIFRNLVRIQRSPESQAIAVDRMLDYEVLSSAQFEDGKYPDKNRILGWDLLEVYMMLRLIRRELWRESRMIRARDKTSASLRAVLRDTIKLFRAAVAQHGVDLTEPLSAVELLARRLTGWTTRPQSYVLDTARFETKVLFPFAEVLSRFFDPRADVTGSGSVETMVPWRDELLSAWEFPSSSFSVSEPPLLEDLRSRAMDAWQPFTRSPTQADRLWIRAAVLSYFRFSTRASTRSIQLVFQFPHDLLRSLINDLEKEGMINRVRTDVYDVSPSGRKASVVPYWQVYAALSDGA